jgi:hypothetical protein
VTTPDLRPAAPSCWAVRAFSFMVRPWRDAAPAWPRNTRAASVCDLSDPATRPPSSASFASAREPRPHGGRR